MTAGGTAQGALTTMWSFAVYDAVGNPAVAFPLRHAHLIGPDDVGVVGEIGMESGVIVARKRSTDAVGLALLADAGTCGRLLLPTCLLPPRETPYLLYLELARHRFKLIYTKMEDWHLFDLEADSAIMRGLKEAQDAFTEAMILERHDPPRAQEVAMLALQRAIEVSEQLTVLYADVMLAKRFREPPPGSGTRTLGCTAHQSRFAEPLARVVEQDFDFVCIPIRWREIEPEEGEYDWSSLDRWMQWASQRKMPVIAGPIVDFRPRSVPEWLYVWEHDYDTTHDLLHTHIEEVVNRYKKVVDIWNVASSLHVNESFTLAYDQIMDLTRMATSLVKALHPRAKTLLEITKPFGEYFATNAKSIPPLVYGETVAQAGFRIDYMGVNLQMGHHTVGEATRDLMQISAQLDKLRWMEMPIIITGIGAPSHRPKTATEDEIGDPAGWWREPWSPEVQGEWLRKVTAIGLSKSFVDSVCVHELYDHPTSSLPFSGLITAKGQAKPAFNIVATIHRDIEQKTFRASRPEERVWSAEELTRRAAVEGGGE